MAFDASNRLYVNLDERIPLLIREAECLVKMGAPLPMLARTFLAKRDYFGLVADSLHVRILEIQDNSIYNDYKNIGFSYSFVLNFS